MAIPTTALEQIGAAVAQAEVNVCQAGLGKQGNLWHDGAATPVTFWYRVTGESHGTEDKGRNRKIETGTLELTVAVQTNIPYADTDARPFRDGDLVELWSGSGKFYRVHEGVNLDTTRFVYTFAVRQTRPLDLGAKT